MRVNSHSCLASSLLLCLAATACTSGSTTSEVRDGAGEGGVGAESGASRADAGTGGATAADAATPGNGAEQDGPTEVDGSVADSGTGSSGAGNTSDSGDGGSASTDPDSGATQGTGTIVWNGESVSPACSSWANPSNTCSTATQTAASHSPPTAVAFTFNDQSGNWPGGGWDWVNGQVGPYGTDITSMKNFTFWLKTQGQVVELSFNLLCNGAPALDQPQHHTGKVVVSTYGPQWNDGNWHRISVPLADLTQPAGFDAQHVAEFQFFNTGAGDGTFFFDDLAFNDF